MTRVIKVEKILVPAGEVDKIAAHFGCSRISVYNALAYRNNSNMAASIRKSAIEKYGGVRAKLPIAVE